MSPEAWLRVVAQDIAILAAGRRQSLAQEIDGCLKARGFHSPGTAVPADLIPAVGRALAAQAAYAEQLLEVLRYAVDNPEFDSDYFDEIARAAIAKAEAHV